MHIPRMGSGAASPGRPVSADVDPELISAYLARGWWRDRTIIDDLYDHAARGGENIPVVEVEGLLLEHAKVAQVAMVGVPDERLGERAAAVIVPAGPDDPPTLAELTSFV